tara:strand:- start:287 stop:514 length:228 start_codon:yes stop_codon:yes gene_type:complete
MNVKYNKPYNGSGDLIWFDFEVASKDIFWYEDSADGLTLIKWATKWKNTKKRAYFKKDNSKTQIMVVNTQPHNGN